MRLSCNFVNVYTIAYHVQYTYTCVQTRAPLTDILARKSARVGQVGRQVGEDPLAKVGEDVRVGVGVGPVEFSLYESRHLV